MMEKVMIKQAVGQPRTETQALNAGGPQALPGKKPAKGEKGDGKEFEAEMALAALLVPQAQIQPGQPQQQQSVGKAGEAAQQAVAGGNPAQAQQQQQPSELALKAAASSNTGSVIAGLSQPQVKEWVHEGEGPMPQASATASKDAKLSLPAGQPAAGMPQAPTRGETDTALASKLELLSHGHALKAGKAGAVSAQDAGAGTQLMQQSEVTPAMQLAMVQGDVVPLEVSMAAAAAGNAQQHAGAQGSPDMMEAQLASMGGVIQGLMPQQQADARGAVGVAGRSLVPGAKGRLPEGTAQAGLSGDEFLSTLGAVKGGIAQSRLEQSQLSQEQQGEGKGAGLGSKPSLRVIHGGVKGGKPEFETELTASQSMNNLAASGTQSHAGLATAGAGVATEVTGHVTKGANAEDRLSSESLAGITSGLRNISSQGAGGEMRIRLKPENLGELHVRVVTDGRNVGLQIQATDEKARKIIEESMSHLKESMAAQNLSLGAVDLTVASSHGAAFGDSRNGQSQAQSHGQGMFNDMLGQQGAGQGSQREGGNAWSGAGDGASASRVARMSAGGAPASAQSFGPARAAYAASGRLDVKA